MITWADIIELTCRLYNIKQKDISDFLGPEAPTLSKIKKGHQNVPDGFAKKYYTKLLNPSTAYPYNRNFKTVGALLYSLESIIECDFENIKQAMEKIWIDKPMSLSEGEVLEKYEKFAKTLLELTVSVKESSTVATKGKRQSKKKTAQVPQSNDNLVEIIPLDYDKIREIVNRSADQFLDK